MRSLTPRLSVLLALALTACNGLPGNGGDQLTQGTTDFTSAGTGDNGGGSSQKSADGAVAESAPSANDASADRNSGTQRTVEEGDVFRLDGPNNTLYVLNMYRGLQIVDVSDRDQPRKRGTAPILGAPVEMYLRDGYAIVVVSDYFSWQQVEDGQLRPFHGSQVRVVDVRNPDAPVEVGRVEVEGAVSETRMVGDVLYVVANRWAWYDNSGSQDLKDALEVTSVDLSDPSSPRQGNTLRYEGTTNVVHASPTTLYVSSPRFDGEARTTVHVVDIADAGGTLAESGAIEVPGTSEHRFQLDEYQDTFRIVTHEGGWGEQGAQHLTVFQRGDDKAFSKLGELALTSTGGLFSTRFDGDRAYLVTMVSVDPLHVVDLKDPAAPTQVELEIPGVIQQLVPRGDRLLALGTDNGWAGVAASLFDVGDPTKPALLARVPVGKGSAWSNANWDDKALRVLDDEGMMLVPFQGWVQETAKPVDPPPTGEVKEEGDATDDTSSGSSAGSSGSSEPVAPDAKPSSTGRYVNGFQIIGFDREGLSALGVVEQEGPVGRTTFHDERILSISDRVLQSVDATDRKAPRVTAKLELARDVNDFVLAAGHAVTLSTSGWAWESTVAELRVAAAASPEDGVVGRLELPFYPQRLLADGDGVVVLGYPHSWDGTARAVRVSLADVANPTLVGAPVKLGAAYAQDGSSTWLNLQSAVLAREGVVAVPAVAYGQVGDKWVSRYAVVTVELATGTLGGVELPGVLAGELMVSDGKVWTSHQEEVGTVDGRAAAKYFADALDVSSAAQPALEARINIPGALLAVEGDLLFTRDYQWLEEGKQINALAVVRREGDKARLLDYEKLDAELGAITVHDGRLYAVTAPWWWAGNTASTSVSSSDGTTTTADATDNAANQPPPSLLKVYALSNGSDLVEVSSTPVMPGVQVRAEAGGHLLLGAGGGYYGGGRGKVAVDMAYPGMYFGGAQALLDYTLTDPDRPAFRQAIRTPGWVQGLAAQDDVLFISSGIYGIQRVKLTP